MSPANKWPANNPYKIGPATLQDEKFIDWRNCDQKYAFQVDNLPGPNHQTNSMKFYYCTDTIYNKKIHIYSHYFKMHEPKIMILTFSIHNFSRLIPSNPDSNEKSTTNGDNKDSTHIKQNKQSQSPVSSYFNVSF